MKRIRILGISFFVTFAVALLLMLNIPMWLRVRSGNVENLQTVSFLSLEDNDLVEGEICYVLGCAASERSGIWSTELYGKSEKRYYLLWQPSGQTILYATNDATEQKLLEQIAAETLAYVESAAVYQKSGDYEDLLPPVTALRICGVVSRLSEDVQVQLDLWSSRNAEDLSGTSNSRVYISHTGFQCYTVCTVLGVILFGISILLGCCAAAEKRKNAAAQ